MLRMFALDPGTRKTGWARFDGTALTDSGVFSTEQFITDTYMWVRIHSILEQANAKTAGLALDVVVIEKPLGMFAAANMGFAVSSALHVLADDLAKWARRRKAEVVWLTPQESKRLILGKVAKDAADKKKLVAKAMQQRYGAPGDWDENRYDAIGLGAAYLAKHKGG